MQLQYYGKINYTMDQQHPDIQYVENWTEDKTFSYNDTYTLDSGMYLEEPEEHIVAYIKRDLKIIAGGGYNADHIHNVEFEIRRIA